MDNLNVIHDETKVMRSSDETITPQDEPWLRRSRARRIRFRGGLSTTGDSAV